MYGIDGIIGGILAAAVVRWVVRRKSDAPKRDPQTDDVILQYDVRFRAFLLIVGLALLVSWCAILARRQFVRPLDAYGGTLIIVPGALWTLLEGLRTNIRITLEGLVKKGAWGRTQILPWSGIREVKFSIFSQWFVFIGIEGTRLRVSFLMDGIGELEKAVRAHLQPPSYTHAETGFRLNRARSTRAT
jgi:uncharacterized membrane protein